jgi:hypothetical protein
VEATVPYPPPAPPYVGPASYKGGSNNKPIRRIVLHGTVSPTERGGARRIAAYFRSDAARGSAHYVVDPGEVVQVVYDSDVAYHDGVNVNSLGVEMCDPVEGPITRWDDRPHRQMLRRCARLTAELALAYDVPVRWVGVKALRAGRQGITDHDKMSKAFRKSTHWDLGAFRRYRFMRLVRAEVDRIKTPERRPTRVTKARALVEDALDLLAAVPAKRKRVHRVSSEIHADLDRLPER